MRAYHLLLLCIAATASSFTFPPGQQDGFYHVYLNSSGYEVHELIEPAGVSSRTLPLVDIQAQTIPKRWGAWRSSWCGCGLTMDHASCDAANANMVNQLNAGAATGAVIYAGTAWYAISGPSVAFLCNNWDGDADCDGDPENWSVPPGSLVSTFTTDITNACGWYVPGTNAHYSDDCGYNGHSQTVFLLYGYMNYYSGLDFCANAAGSSSSSC